MNVDSILLSEFASPDPTGRVTIVNVFNRLQGPGPKWGIPFIYLTMIVHGPVREAGNTYDGVVRIINRRRELVTDQPIPFKVAFPPEEMLEDEGMPVRAIVGVALAGVRFDEPGPYAFEVYIDGDFAAATMLAVKRTEQAPGS